LVGFDLQKRDQENLAWMIKMLALSKVNDLSRFGQSSPSRKRKRYKQQ
jgi:hypothetical protein